FVLLSVLDATAASFRQTWRLAWESGSRQKLRRGCSRILADSSNHSDSRGRLSLREQNFIAAIPPKLHLPLLVQLLPATRYPCGSPDQLAVIAGRAVVPSHRFGLDHAVKLLRAASHDSIRPIRHAAISMLRSCIHTRWLGSAATRRSWSAGIRDT